MRSTAALPSVLSLLFLLGAPSPAGAQRAVCDTNLVRLASNSNGYRDRGNRCEGKYSQQISGNTLLMASFTEAFQPYRSETLDTMRVEWPDTVKDSVLIRAEALRRGQYYRMDAAQAGNGSFYWPSRLLANVSIRGGDIGIIAWTRSSLRGRGADLFVPLRVRIGSTPVSCTSYTITLLPGPRLDEVYVTLTSLDSLGQLASMVRDHKPINRSPYPAEVPIVFRIRRDEIPHPGIYLLRVDVRLSGGGTSSLERYLLLGAPCP